ncbi:transcription factor CP2-like protein 1 isoform X2 [Paramisgurnus dabryanus]|uniref:transcription factor CP2-like protein 1 isoform X2 n=1 Tax=Paramisgurnus dabryanus TaxID=90735 RepID=UPI0031F3527B
MESVFLIQSRGVYHALYLKDLTVFELTEKIANLYNVPSQQIHHVYRQRAEGDLRLGFGCDGSELHRGDQLYNQHFER